MSGHLTLLLPSQPGSGSVVHTVPFFMRNGRHPDEIKIDTEHSSPNRLSQSVDALLSCGRLPPPDSITAKQFNQFFNESVPGDRRQTADLPPLLSMASPTGCALHDFGMFSADGVMAAIRRLPNKQNALNPLPSCSRIMPTLWLLFDGYRLICSLPPMEKFRR